MATHAWMAFLYQADHCLFREVLNGLEADQDQGLDARDFRVEGLHFRSICQSAQPDFFHFAWLGHSEYPLHGAAPLSVGW